jgi:hypothetical protein
MLRLDRGRRDLRELHANEECFQVIDPAEPIRQRLSLVDRPSQRSGVDEDRPRDYLRTS